MEQKISTPIQQFWLSKLMGFDYDIQYRSGNDNVAANAPSRVGGSKILFFGKYMNIYVQKRRMYKTLCLKMNPSKAHLPNSPTNHKPNKETITRQATRD